MADVREPAAAGNAAHVHDKLHAAPEQQPGELVAGGSAVPDRKQAPARRILTRRSASRILLAGTSGTSGTANTPLVTSPRQHRLVECGPVSHQSSRLFDSSADNYYNSINKNKPWSIVMTAVS